MKIINEQYKFSFIIPDDYKELNRNDYFKYHIHGNTLHVFIKSDDPLPRTISINRDTNVKDENDYLKLVSLNIENLEKMGMHVTNHIHQNSGRARVDIVYTNFKTIHFVTYFTVIHNVMIASSIEINEINDEHDQVLASLFDSIEEF